MAGSADGGRPVVPLRMAFVPSNSSQMGKFGTIMEALRARGDDVRAINVDAAYEPVFAAATQIESSGFPFERLPDSRFDPNGHWLRQIAQKPHLERAFASVLERIEPDVLVFGNDSFVSGRTFVRAARRRGIATVLIPDGLVVPPNTRHRMSAWGTMRDGMAQFIRRLFHAGGPRGLSGVDGILLINSMGRDVLARQGVAPRRIHVVGSPEYDRLAQTWRREGDAEEDRDLRRRLGIPQGRPVILLAHQPLDGRERALIGTIVSAARLHEAVVLTKFHPRGREDPASWRSWAAREGMSAAETHFVVAECTSIEAVRLASVCVTAYSTVSLEALVCGVPLVLVQYLNTPFALAYGREYGAALEAGSPRELVEAITAILTSEATRARLATGRVAAIHGELHDLDGKSVERTMDAIDHVVAEARGRGRGARS